MLSSASCRSPGSSCGTGSWVGSILVLFRPRRGGKPAAKRALRLGDADDGVRMQDVPDAQVHRELELGELLVEDEPAGLRAAERAAEAREERDQPVRVGRIGEIE